MELETNTRKKSLAVWILALFVPLFIISSLYLINIRIGIENFSNTVSLPAYTIIPGTLVVLSIWAITRSETIRELPRKSIIFLALSFTSWFLAEQTWNLYEHVFMIDPYPSIADVFYIIAPIFMLISLSIFLKSTGKKISKKSIVLASIVSLIILVPSLIFTLDIDAENDPIEIIIAVSYPVVDAILLVPAIITVLFLISKRSSFFWLMIIAGIIIMLSADTGYLFLVIADEYVDGHPIDILWVSAYTIWAYMMAYIIFKSKKNNPKNGVTEIYEKYGSKKLEQYGVFLGLVLINSTVAILLIGINYFANPDPENTILPFFSWIFVMIVIIFSSIVVLLNSNLNKTLQKRTKQLEETTTELVKSERFSAIGELASRISHDIRNPLSNIHMSIELIKKSPPETKIADGIINEKLELVSKNIERISHQVNDVLGFVQNRQLKKEVFEVQRSLRETLETINVPKNISIKYPKSKTMIFGDYFQLQIVFNNLILNAIQAIEKEKGEIIIRILDEKETTIIEIENSGPAIPENILPHIFESLVTTKQVGTGLGLVSCKTIIQNHMGEISAKNDPTTFTISLPKPGNYKKIRNNKK
jgi:signal transduction histidine kinase